MVSTRGIRYKFSEGERVLCYEPDPTKAKVLYDSKVLEVIESKDKRGRRTVEYLIHFQGWNSSWDRCVSEDFVLKDTEENRQLQRDLAEKSQLQLGAYLYRRERKKGSGSSSTVAGPAKRARQGFSDDGSSSSTQPDGHVYMTTEGEAGDTDSSSSGSGSASRSGSGSSSQRRSPPPHAHVGRAHIALPSALRDRLTFDYHLVVKRGRLSRLPATPCAAEILESFVKWFARAGAWHPQRARHDPPQRPDLLDVSCRLNLVREVADGLRVYFDFILRGHLLYKQELNQYHEICGQFIEKQEVELKIELEENSMTPVVEEAQAAVEEEIKSPKIPEYSHLPPDPVGEKAEESTTPLNNVEEPPPAPVQVQTESSERGRDSADDAPPRPATRSGNLPRRLRSYKSAVSQSETEEPAPSTSAEPRPFETLSSRTSVHSVEAENPFERSAGSNSGSSLASEAWSRASAPAPSPAPHAPTRTPLSLLLDKVGTRNPFERSAGSNSGSSLASEAWSRASAPAPSPAPHAPTRTPLSLLLDKVGTRNPFERSAGSNSGSSLASEAWSRASAPAPSPAPHAPTRTPLSLLLDKVGTRNPFERSAGSNSGSSLASEAWSRASAPAPSPAPHAPRAHAHAALAAARQVKLPDFLNATQMPDFKLKLILKHIDMFVQYLDEHNEWFGEMYYVADSMSRSH